MLEAIQRNHIRRHRIFFQSENPNDLHSYMNFSIDLRYFVTRILIDYQIHMLPNDDEKEVFANILDEVYQNNSDSRKIVEQFHQNYSSENPIEWIFSDHRFIKILSDVFDWSNIASLLPCAFLFRDVMKQFQRYQCTVPVETYLSFALTTDDLNNWTNQQGKYVVCSTFLSTCRDELIAIASVDDKDCHQDKKRALLAIRADPKTNGILPFVNKSVFGLLNKQEVIFMIGSLFRVDSVDADDNRVVRIQLTLSGVNENLDHQTFFKRYNQRYIEHDRGTFIGFMRLIVDMGIDLNDASLMSIAENCVTSIISHSSEKDPEMSNYYDLLGLIEQSKQNWDASIIWHQKSIVIREKLVSAINASLEKNYQSVDECFRARSVSLSNRTALREQSSSRMRTTNDPVETEEINDYELSLDLMNHHLDYVRCQSNRLSTSTKLSSSTDHKRRKQSTIDHSLAHMYKELGTLYEQFGQSDKARMSFQKAGLIYRDLESTDDRK